MILDNDEQIVATDDAVFAGKENESELGVVHVKLSSMKKAPMEESRLRVMVEVSGEGDVRDRAGLDLVMVLDISGSMMGERMEKLNLAMEVVITKLSPIDRLSVVTFSNDAELVCPLRQMTKRSQEEIIRRVRQITARGWTNTTAGLQLGLRVLLERRFKHRRSVGIMLLSDGEQTRGGDARMVEIGQVPVYTFGFGSELKDRDPRATAEVLVTISRNSYGGTYSDVINTNDLSIAFAQCLAGLLTVVVQDLKVIVTPENESVIETVHAGDYAVSHSGSARTISLRNLSNKEMRRLMIEIILPPVSSEATRKVLRVAYKYNNEEGTEINSIPVFEHVNRTCRKFAEQENIQVMIEGNRLQIAKMMKEARILADDDQMENARNKLVEAKNILENTNIDNRVIDMLKSEINRILTSMKSKDSYEGYGRRFALSSELSHERQRFAGRGFAGIGDTGNLQLFATPRMVAYLEQTILFEEDPKTKSLPTLEEDVKKELAYAKQLNTRPCTCCPCNISLKYYIKRAIENLRAIDNIVDTK